MARQRADRRYLEEDRYDVEEYTQISVELDQPGQRALRGVRTQLKEFLTYYLEGVNKYTEEEVDKEVAVCGAVGGFDKETVLNLKPARLDQLSLEFSGIIIREKTVYVKMAPSPALEMVCKRMFGDSRGPQVNRSLVVGKLAREMKEPALKDLVKRLRDDDGRVVGVHWTNLRMRTEDAETGLGPVLSLISVGEVFIWLSAREKQESMRANQRRAPEPSPQDMRRVRELFARLNRRHYVDDTMYTTAREEPDPDEGKPTSKLAMQIRPLAGEPETQMTVKLKAPAMKARAEVIPGEEVPRRRRMMSSTMMEGKSPASFQVTLQESRYQTPGGKETSVTGRSRPGQGTQRALLEEVSQMQEIFGTKDRGASSSRAEPVAGPSREEREPEGGAEAPWYPLLGLDEETCGVISGLDAGWRGVLELAARQVRMALTGATNINEELVDVILRSLIDGATCPETVMAHHRRMGQILGTESRNSRWMETYEEKYGPKGEKRKEPLSVWFGPTVRPEDRRPKILQPNALMVLLTREQEDIPAMRAFPHLTKRGNQAARDHHNAIIFTLATNGPLTASAAHKELEEEGNKQIMKRVLATPSAPVYGTAVELGKKSSRRRKTSEGKKDQGTPVSRSGGATAGPESGGLRRKNLYDQIDPCPDDYELGRLYGGEDDEEEETWAVRTGQGLQEDDTTTCASTEYGDETMRDPGHLEGDGDCEVTSDESVVTACEQQGEGPSAPVWGGAGRW